MSFLTNIQLGSATQPGVGFTVNRYVNAGAFKLVINGTGSEIFELTTGVAGATRRFSWAVSGRYTMDAYGVGTFTGTATKWLAVTAAGIVIEETPPTGSSITADNGLTMSTATNVQLGATAVGANSPLLHDTYINTSTFILNAIGSSSANPVLNVENTNTTTSSVAIRGTSANGGNSNAVEGLSDTQAGVYGYSTSGYGVYAETISGRGLVAVSNGANVAIEGLVLSTSTNTVLEVTKTQRLTTGTAANGIGSSHGIYLEDAGGNSNLSNQLISKWTTAANATRTSSLVLQGVLSASTVDLLTLAGDGSVKLRPITATAASAITPAEGMLVFTSDTNGTFATIGIYCYENGTWNKL